MLLHEQRAKLVRLNRKFGGFLRWKDTLPHFDRKGTKYTGFVVSQYFATKICCVVQLLYGLGSHPAYCFAIP